MCTSPANLIIAGHRTAKNSIAIVHCMLIILCCSSDIYYWYVCFWSLEMKFYVNAISSAKTLRFIGGSLTHKTSAIARTGIGRFVKRFFNVPSASQTSYDARPGTVCCPDGHRLSRTIYIFNKIARYPADVILPSLTLPNAVRAPWNFKNTLISPGTVQCLQN